jgi:hypothetical protein
MDPLKSGVGRRAIVAGGIEKHLPAGAVERWQRAIRERPSCALNKRMKLLSTTGRPRASVSPSRHASPEYPESARKVVVQSASVISVPSGFSHMMSPGRRHARVPPFEEAPAPKHRVIAAKIHYATCERQKSRARIVFRPVDPGNRIVLAVRVVVAGLSTRDSSPAVIMGTPCDRSTVASRLRD